ncbi:hypothetical protein LSH36_365g05050 [Paralvinella palmiformis]|uniref:Carbohydrate sulfotransferase n=1 Tax=Paralvinella palmiformis TaxID=53620 RepID=A0AAD9MZC4_9ANNE|nr:hypothetical protein LSH36_365g05050 [Paralvinella palmiformis]
MLSVSWRHLVFVFILSVIGILLLTFFSEYQDVRIYSSSQDPVESHIVEPSPIYIADDSTTHGLTESPGDSGSPIDSSNESPAEMSTIISPLDNPAVCATATRAARVLDLCQRRGYDKDDIKWDRLSRNLIIDDKHQIIFCSIPKCGSKSFKHYLGKISRSDFFVGWSVNMKIYYNLTGLRYFNDLSEFEKDKVWKGYFKLMVVRHPFDRLRSAWLHKMGEPGSSHILKGMETIVDDHLRHLDSSRSRTFNYRDEYLKFEPFLELVHQKWEAGFRNAHWASYYEHCQPCHVHYDHVFRLETLEKDVEVMYQHLLRLNASEPIYRITHDNNVRSAKGIEKMKQIKTVYENIDKRTIQGLLDFYESDFSFFGYKWDIEEGATCLYDDLQCC